MKKTKKLDEIDPRMSSSGDVLESNMVNDLTIYNRLRVDPAFKSWFYEKMILCVNYYLTAVDKRYFSALKTVDAIVMDFKKAVGIIKA